MSIDHFLMQPEDMRQYGSETVKLAEDIAAKLKEIDALLKSIRTDKDYKSNIGSDALIATAEGQFPMLLKGAATTEKYGNFATYAGNTTQGTDEDIASEVARRMEEI